MVDPAEEAPPSTRNKQGLKAQTPWSLQSQEDEGLLAPSVRSSTPLAALLCPLAGVLNVEA